MRILRRPLQIIRADLRTYVVLNVVTYGLLVIGFVAGLLFPALTADRVDALENDGTADLVRNLLSTPWLFAATILGVNVVSVGLLRILLPSLVLPFAGLVLFWVWAAITGVTLVPTSDIGWVAMIPHSLTVLIEFQAYIVLAFGAYLLGRAWLRPKTVDAVNRRQAYLRGLQRIGWLSIPTMILLVIGAIYEALSLAYLVGPLSIAILGMPQ